MHRTDIGRGSSAAEAVAALQQVYCRLAPSKYHGVGVIAVRNIPSGTVLFANEDEPRGRYISQNKLLALGAPEAAVAMCVDYYCAKGDKIFVPSTPFHLPTSYSCFLNHSKRPNLKLKTDGSYMTLCEVLAGQELTEDYDEICAHESSA